MSHSKAIRTLLGGPIVAFHSSLARIFGGIAAALMLQQLIYWGEVYGDADGWFERTGEQFEAVTTLNWRRQQTARAKLVEAGVLEESRRGIPARLAYRIRLDALADLLQKRETTSARTAEPATEKPRDHPYRENVYTGVTAGARAGASALAAAIAQSWEAEISMLTPAAFDTIAEFTSEHPDMPPAWVPKAFAEAAQANARNWRYVVAILLRWARDGPGARRPARGAGRHHGTSRAGKPAPSGDFADDSRAAAAREA